MASRRSRRVLDTTEVVRKLREFLSERPEVRLAWLFGSRARGDGGPNSDVDVALYCGDALPVVPLAYRTEMMSELRNLLHDDAVDVILLEETPPLLAHRVLRDGLVLVSRDEGERVRHAARALLRYLDTRPLLELQARYLARRYLDGKPAAA